MEYALGAAFALGFLGSVHCVGMCGPLVLALPIQQMSAVGRSLSAGVYHTGRITVYALIGLVFGLAGRRVYLAGWQQGLSIGLGVLILCWVVLQNLPRNGRRFIRANPLHIRLQQVMIKLWTSPSRSKFFWMGAANGLLPCGMVYMAIAGALTSTGPLPAMGFMVFFGLGTLPTLVGLQVTGHMVGADFRIRLRSLLPWLTGVMAILLILRGLNLGIPFVSPVLAGRPPQAVSCH